MYRKHLKRIIDFFLSIILIILTSPLMLIVALITFFNLGLPIHNEIREREGLNKKIFIMYKFRTKKINAKRNKFTKVSRFIDRSRLNELPQLFNVLKGDMSLVGPRPFIPGDTLPEGKISNKRYLLRPGMTGLAQVSGGRGLTHKEKLKYDVIYYDNLTFKMDLIIVLKTVVNIFKLDR